MTKNEERQLENDAEYAAIETMIRLSRGFTLGFIVSNHPRILGEVQDRLRNHLGDASVATTTLSAHEPIDLLELLREIARPSEVKVVLIYGMDELLDPEGTKRV